MYAHRTHPDRCVRTGDVPASPIVTRSRETTLLNLNPLHIEEDDSLPYIQYPDLLGVIESVINTPLCRIRISSHRFTYHKPEHVCLSIYLYLSVSRGPEHCICIHECYSNHAQHRPSVCLVCTWSTPSRDGPAGSMTASERIPCLVGEFSAGFAQRMNIFGFRVSDLSNPEK